MLSQFPVRQFDLFIILNESESVVQLVHDSLTISSLKNKQTCKYIFSQ